MNWKRILDSFNPTLTCRRYLVTIGGFAMGTSKDFWRLRSALRYFDAHGHEGLWVMIVDLWTGKCIKQTSRKYVFVTQPDGSLLPVQLDAEGVRVS